MALATQAQLLRSEINKTHRVQALRINAADWHGDTAARTRAINMTLASKRHLLSMVDNAMASPEGGDKLGDAKDALQKMQFDVVQSLVREPTSTENRLAKAVEFEKYMSEQRAKFLAMTKTVGDVTGAAGKLVTGCKAVSGFLLELAQNPKKYAMLAVDFANGNFGTKVVRQASALMRANKVFGKYVPQPDDAEGFLAVLKLDYPNLAANIEKVLAVLKGAVVVVQVVTTFFSEMARAGNWSVSIAKAAVTGAYTAATIVAAEAIQAAVMTTLTATLAAVGATIEVPPVAAVLAASGLVLVVGLAIGALFDLLIKCCWGTPVQGLSVALTATTAVSLETSLTAKLDISLLPN